MSTEAFDHRSPLSAAAPRALPTSPVEFAVEAAVPWDVVLAVLATAIGAGLIAAATATTAPLIGIWPGMLLALALPWRRDRLHRKAARASLSMFGVCTLVAGFSAVYQTIVFGSNMESTLEIPLWYSLSRGIDVPGIVAVNAPYAVAVWRATYNIAASLGLGDGLWIGLMVNALVMASAAAVIVTTAGKVFPNDWQRLRRATRLTLCCAMFWLFGGLLVRDAFALFLQVVLLATFVSFLRYGRPTIRRLFTHGAVVALVAWLVIGIRREMLVIIPVLIVLAIVSAAIQGRGLRRFAVLGIGVTASLVVLGLAMEQIVGTIITGQEGYLRILTYYDQGGISGLGYRLVVSQPIWIRSVTGFIYMHVFPIPVWTGFNLESTDYLWLKSFSAVFIILVTPAAALGFWRIVQNVRDGRRGMAALTFVALYWPVMVLAVALTSLETRHLGQFMPAFILLAAAPDMRQRYNRVAFRRMAMLWYGIVALGHLLWFGVR